MIRATLESVLIVAMVVAGIYAAHAIICRIDSVPIGIRWEEAEAIHRGLPRP